MNGLQLSMSLPKLSLSLVTSATLYTPPPTWGPLMQKLLMSYVGIALFTVTAVEAQLCNFIYGKWLRTKLGIDKNWDDKIDHKLVFEKAFASGKYTLEQQRELVAMSSQMTSMAPIAPQALPPPEPMTKPVAKPVAKPTTKSSNAIMPTNSTAVMVAMPPIPTPVAPPATLATPSYACSVCHSQIQYGQRFCSGCGAKIPPDFFHSIVYVPVV